MAKTPPPSPALLDLLSQLSKGSMSVDQAASLIGSQNLGTGPKTNLDANRTASIDGATVDLGRGVRCGFSEVIFGEGKPSELIVEIVRAQLAADQTSLITRIEPTTASQVRRAFGHTHYNPVARTLRVADAEITPCESVDPNDLADQVHVAVVTAGSTDIPVAEEAVETLGWMGVPVNRFDDVGVAGPQRLLACAPSLQHAAAVVVVAGMEGALPAAVGGYVPCPIFAVPTSIGYGTNLGGLTPMMGMLCSCAANVAVVNIDAGFKGGYMAGMIAERLKRATESRPSESAGDSGRSMSGAESQAESDATSNSDA